MDESDGSIAFFEPRVAVVNNISLDHKSLDELRMLFRGFVANAQTVVLNLDNAETAALLAGLKPGQAVTYSLGAAPADLVASPPVRSPAGIAFQVKARDTDEAVEVALKVPGLHNVANALAALSAAKACGVPLAAAAAHLGEFSGIRRRLEVVGAANDITVVDDFAHNPDKIAATLETMHAFPGRLLLMFQPHGYGPMRLMRDALVDCFAGRVARRGRPGHARARLFRRHGRPQRRQRRDRERHPAAWPQGLCFPRPRRLRRPAGQARPSSAIASWSWARATIRFRSSRASSCNGLQCQTTKVRSPRVTSLVAEVPAAGGRPGGSK